MMTPLGHVDPAFTAAHRDYHPARRIRQLTDRGHSDPFCATAPELHQHWSQDFAALVRNAEQLNGIADERPSPELRVFRAENG